jgi:ubiquinone/menaquinone biosynthesis C-methylase UbiE
LLGGVVGFYARRVLPHLINAAMKNKDATRLRGAWVPEARGRVLEIGIGSGLNLPFYSSKVECVFGVEPSAELQKMAEERVKHSNARVEFLSQSAEDTIALADDSVDTVVMTWTLCSISDPMRALAQMKRVLKPDGRMLFIEHGKSPDAGVARWQDRLTPAWRKIGGGCHLNRKIDDLLGAGRFKIQELKTCYLPGPRPMTYTYQGFASHS